MEAVIEAVDGQVRSDTVKEWILKRNCSVTPAQFLAFYVFLASVSLSVALFMLLRGAWMILPFTSVELTAVATAFVIYARHAVDYERIRLFEHRLVVERMCAERFTCFEFNPRWVRVEPGLTPRDRITLHSAGKSVAVGEYLALHRRAEFATELRIWLRRCS